MGESSNIVERVRDHLDIVEEIGAVVSLKKSGKAYKGLCPFHGERTPSFYVFPEKGTWTCFGCHEHGDVFTFFEKHQSLDFRDALALLAERAGVPFSPERNEDEPAFSPEHSAKLRLRSLNEAAAIWFHHQLLQSGDAQYARTYLASRGVQNESITLWRLGYAPDGERLSRYLQEQGYSPSDLIEAGLSRERDSARGGGLYDYFRNRLIFPIRDIQGRTIAFGGRELGSGQPKYLNTPQTPLFDKSATLYGLDLARETIKRNDKVVIVEGYMDVILPAQSGYRNVVACIGSAITEKHIRQIKKLTRRVALALDPDAAGKSATVRGITVAQQAFDKVLVPVPGTVVRSSQDRRGEPRGMVRFEEQVDAEITVVRLPPHEDPDEFVRRDPPGWQRAVDQAQPLIDFLIETETAGLSLDTPQGKMEAAQRLLPVIAEVRNRTLADEYVGRLAARIRLDKLELRRDLVLVRQRLERESRQVTRQHQREEEIDQSGNPVEDLGEKYSESGQNGPGTSYSASVTAHKKPAMTGTAARFLAEVEQEEHILCLLLEYPTVWSDIFGIVAEGDFAGTETRALFQAFVAAVQVTPSLGAHQFLEELPPLLQATAQRIRYALPPGMPQDGKGIAKAATKSAYRLKDLRLKEEIVELEYLLRDVEDSLEPPASRELIRQLEQVLIQKRAIDEALGSLSGSAGSQLQRVARLHPPRQ
ncbi:MAG: DNA primase [Ktedonobacterales bacterium]